MFSYRDETKGTSMTDFIRPELFIPLQANTAFGPNFERDAFLASSIEEFTHAGRFSAQWSLHNILRAIFGPQPIVSATTSRLAH